MLHRSPIKSAVMTVSQWSLVSGLRVGTIAILLPLFLVGTGGRSIAAEKMAQVPVRQSSFKDKISQQLLATKSQQQTSRKTALVIGNGNYVGKSDLKNPPNDARDITKALKQLGFGVTLKIDANKKEMRNAINEFEQELKRNGGIGVFYYAGHAVQVEQKNYFIPVGMNIDRESDVEDEAVPLNKVINVMKNAENPVNVIIVDACRDNPYKSFWRSDIKGLAPISVDGTLISFSAAPGERAADGGGSNSPYTESLLKYIQEPGIDIEEIFRLVRQAVREKTNNKQKPWDQSSLAGKYFFKPIEYDSQTALRPTISVAAPQTQKIPLETDSASPVTAQDFFERAEKKRIQGNDKGAIADYDRAIQLNPSYIDSYVKRGRTHTFSGNYRQAIIDYDKAIQLNPNYTDAYVNRGRVYFILGDNQSAILDYSQAIRIEPDYVDAYVMRGIARSELGANQAAIADYDQALKNNPERLHTYVLIGNARFAMGDKQGSISAYTQALNPTQEPNSDGLIPPTIVRGDTRFDWLNYASNAYKKPIEQRLYIDPLVIDSDPGEAYKRRGLARLSLGDNDGAIVDLTQALSFHSPLHETSNPASREYADILDLLKKAQS